MKTKRKTRGRVAPNPDTIVMEKNIPVPENAAPLRRQIYPIAKLAPEDSFSFPAESNAAKREKQRLSVLQSIMYHRKSNPAKQFVVRVLEDEGVIRVWRISNDSE